MAHRRAAGPLGVAPVAEAGLDLAAEAAQRGGREDAFRRPADAHDGVDTRPLDRAADRGRQVAVADELDPGAGPADLVDEGVVARPLEDDDRDVVDAATERGRDPLEVLGGRQPDVDLARDARSDAQLLEVGIRGVDEAAFLRCREDGDCPGLAVGDEVRALERVDGDVDPLRRVWIVGLVPADLLADVQHRRLVALPLADDDPSGELDLVHRPAHRLDRRAVGLVLLAAAHEARRSKGRRLGDPNHLERKQLFHV